MATGYTHPILDGEITTLRQFALACARAYLYEFRESNIPIEKSAELMPGVIPGPDTAHHEESLKESEAKLIMLETMSPSEVDDYYKNENKRTEVFYERIETESNEKRVLLQSMLDKVEAWNPPTETHRVGIKKYMIEQLESSIEWERPHEKATPEPETKSVTERHAEKIESLQDDISGTKRRIEKIITNHKKTQDWWSQLRESVPEETVDKPATN